MSPPPSAPASSRRSIIDDRVIFGALMGAIVWNVVTWLAGIPSSSSSHALIGGLVGAGMAKGGLSVIVWSGLGKTAAAIVLSPATGFLLALLLVLLVSWTFLQGHAHARSTRSSAMCSSSRPRAYSLGHGGNDAQKTMGIIAALLFAHGVETGGFHVPLLGGAVLPGGDGAGHACSAAGASCAPWARASPI